QRLIKNSGAQITVTDPAGRIGSHTEIKEAIRAIEHDVPHHITLSNHQVIDEQFILQFQLMVISTEGWKKVIDSRPSWLKQTPSILILQA
ncbi:MAG TPA: cation/H(+) antiporter, partial [Prolixibacteraceae bacterium]|nr:cation/H(+) antiporter [Prolixibacteraceae bacterium]